MLMAFLKSLFLSFLSLFSRSSLPLPIDTPPLPSSESQPPLFLIFIHDSSNRGMYHVSPSIEHLAHALGCCTVDNADDAFLSIIASVDGPSVSSVSSPISHKLNLIPSFIEAQRVLSQAQAPAGAPRDEGHVPQDPHVPN